MIITFSGNGNTAYAAKLLSEALGREKIHTLSADELRNPSAINLRMSKNDSRIIWAFPIYSWNVPPVVQRVIREIPDPDGYLATAGHYMLCTYGDDTGNAQLRWERMMRRRGWTPMGAAGVQMPNTYVCLPGFDTDPAQTVKEKLEKAPARVRQIADAIVSGETFAPILNTGGMEWLKTSVIYPVFRSLLMSPRLFRADSHRCTGCHRCERSCPMANITLDTPDGLPQWGKDCAFCLRCYHVCPHHAISHGPATKNKGQYRIYK